MIKKLLSISGVIVGLVIVLVFTGIGGKIGKEVGQAAFSSSSSMEKELTAALAIAAKQINESAPTMVDEETRMDGASVGPAATITYHLTILNYSSSDIDSGLIRSDIFPSVKSGVCSNEDMKTSLQYGAKYTYSYSGKNGGFIGKFTIDRNDCGISARSS